MTIHSTFIAGDWGTSNLRLYLCDLKDDGQPHILNTLSGPGVSQVNGDFEDTIFKLIEPWLAQHPAAPVLLSGMVGSTIGWRESPYLSCPVSVEQIAEGRVSFTARGTSFAILSGLRTRNPLGNPDVMRGEELQMLGWMKRQKDASSRQLFTLPGTHNKWALMQGDQVENFITGFTGELFALLRDNSILVAPNSSGEFNQAAFEHGVASAEKLNGASLLHSLFSTRAQQVLGEMSKLDAHSYLSGMIIAADVMGALAIWPELSSKVVIIAEPTLAQHYQWALTHFGSTAQCCDPSDIAISGYAAIYQQLFK